MLNKTLVDGLRPYAIGEKLRALRLKKKMGLVQLGQHTGLSPALLSKLERNKLYPTLPTLLRIAMVFSVGLDYFFTDESKRHVVGVVRAGERIRMPEKPDLPTPAYSFECLEFTANERKLNAYLAEFETIASTPHQHTGAEFIYVSEGSLAVQIGTEVYELDSGDSIYFDSSVSHTYRRNGKRKTTAVVVTTYA